MGSTTEHCCVGDEVSTTWIFGDIVKSQESPKGNLAGWRKCRIKYEARCFYSGPFHHPEGKNLPLSAARISEVTQWWPRRGGFAWLVRLQFSPPLLIPFVLWVTGFGMMATLGICYLKWSVLSAFSQFSPVLTTAHLASPVFLGLMVCNVSGLSPTLPAPPHPPHSTLLQRNRSKFNKWLELQSPAADAGGQKSGLLIITWLCPYKGLCHTPGLWTERHFLEA